MQSPTDRRHAIAVLLAAAAPLGLCLWLGQRVLAAGAPDAAPPAASVAVAHPPAPAARVPPPLLRSTADLPAPTCWSCRGPVPLRFGLDLDLLAPLGDGPGNAAAWLSDFSVDGPREREAAEPMIRRRISRPDPVGSARWVLPPDDALLLEAEPWMDQATFRFYEGAGPDRLDARLPNFFLTGILASSWLARGAAAADPEAARADYRRVLRLGRLLLQEEATVIQRIVAVHTIRRGADALHELARREGDALTLAAAGRVHADADGILARLAERLTPVNHAFRITRTWRGLALQMTDDALTEIVALARSDRERLVRFEATLALYPVKVLGKAGQRARATEALEALASDPDATVAALAAWCLAHPHDAEILGSFVAA